MDEKNMQEILAKAEVLIERSLIYSVLTARSLW